MTPNDSKTAPARPAFGTPGGLRASWASKICRENEYILFMDPFGSDTKRYDVHYMCHSTSICHFRHPFLHFPTIFFHSFYKKCCVFDRIRGYLRCGEPEGRRPSALYQNPGSMHFNVFLTSNKRSCSSKIQCFKLN